MISTGFVIMKLVSDISVSLTVHSDDFVDLDF